VIQYAAPVGLAAKRLSGMLSEALPRGRRFDISRPVPVFRRSDVATRVAIERRSQRRQDAELPQFGIFQAVRILGRGGTGVVYLARRTDGQFEQLVAVKTIQSYVATP